MRLADNFFDALAQLEERHRRTKPTKHRPTELLPDAIKTAPQVFQPRQLFGDDVEAHHVRELKRGLAGKPVAKLEELLVMQIGTQTYCIDGHHRLAAYKANGTPYPVPVRWFDGSVREAVRKAAECNTKDKLPMRKADKFEAAWRMVVLGLGSIAEVSRAANVSEATVSNMRSKLRELTEAHANAPIEDDDFGTEGERGKYVCRLTWAEVKRRNKDTSEKDEAWKEKIINEWVGRLRAAFGREWGKQPQLAAEAIHRFSERLPEKLVEAWLEDGVIEGSNLDEDV